MEEYFNILIRTANWVGDAVMSLAALRAVRARFPRARITVLALPWVAGLYRRESWANEIMLYTGARGARDLAVKWRMAHRLRACRFDCAILIPNSFDSALIAWLAGIPRRIGYARDARRWLLTDPVPVPHSGEVPRHESFYYLELLRRAGLIAALPETPDCSLQGAEAARRAGVERFDQLGFEEAPIGVSPGAAYGGAKRWPVERFAQAAAILAHTLARTVVVFGSSSEKPVTARLVELLEAQDVDAYDFAGRTELAEFVELAAACRVFLTNDSGAMHVAAAVGVPTVAVFGSTDPEATGPLGPAVRIVREPVDCAPCLLRECPIDHRCMLGVEPERVAAEALDLLK